MGLLDISSEVLTSYKADASQHKRELQELKNFQAALGEEEGRVAAERNQSLEDWVVGLGKVTLALAAVKEVGSVIMDGYREGLQEARYETAAAGVDMEKLGEAAGGLKTHMELLQFAAKASNSVFHNSQEDMEVAERAIRKMTAAGVDAVQAQEAVENAMNSAKVKGLIPLGVAVDAHLGKLAALGEENLTLAQKTEVHSRAMEALKEFTEGTSDAQDNLGDSMKRTQVSISNSWSELKIELGKLVEAFEPVIALLAKALGYAAQAMKDAGDVKDSVIGVVGDIARGVDMRAHPEKYKFTGDDAFKAFQDSSSDWQSLIGNVDNRWGPGLQQFALMYAQRNINENNIEIDNADFKAHVPTSEEKAAAKEAAKAAMEAAYQAILDSASTDMDFASQKSYFDSTGRGGSKDADKLAFGALAGSSGLGAAADIGGGPDLTNLMKDEAFRNATGTDVSALHKNQREMIQAGDLKQVLDYAQQFEDKQRDNLLTKLFGKPDEMEWVKRSFEALTGATGAMYDAMVTGSESATAAFQKFTAGVVEALGKQMLVQSLKEGAWALGTAFTDPAESATHAAAAAAYAAGAVLAGVVAHELGYGGGSAGSSGGSSSSSSSGRAGNDQRTTNQSQQQTVIVYGDSFADDSPRAREQRARRLVQSVVGTSGGTYS
jgi:hypothetical protein